MGGQARHERALDQAPLVVALLVPRVREEHVDAIQRAFRNHVRQHFHRIVRADADVADLAFADQLEQRTHARLVHFHAQEIIVRTQLCDVGRGFAHAEADLEDALRAGAPEGSFPVERLGGVGELEARAEFVDGALLAGRRTTGAAHVRADAAWVAGFRAAFSVFGGVDVLRFRRGVGGAGARLFDGLHEDPVPCAALGGGQQKSRRGRLQTVFGGAGDGNRTHGSSLGS